MQQNAIYFGKQEFYQIIRDQGGEWDDSKERPIVCLIKLQENDSIYWAVPMGNWNHRDEKAKNRIRNYINLPEKRIESCYYHIGRTTVQSIFFISDVIPITEKYIERQYLGFDGKGYVIKNPRLLEELKRKVSRILYYENHRPNYFRQHITDVKEYLLKEQNQ